MAKAVTMAENVISRVIPWSSPCRTKYQCRDLLRPASLRW